MKLPYLSAIKIALIAEEAITLFDLFFLWCCCFLFSLLLSPHTPTQPCTSLISVGTVFGSAVVDFGVSSGLRVAKF